MTIWMKVAAGSLILLGSQSRAENWVQVASATDDDGETVASSVDKDSIHRGSDGLIYFTEYDDDGIGEGPEAADCSQRILYFIDRTSGSHDSGTAVAQGSIGAAELQYVCANVP